MVGENLKKAEEWFDRAALKEEQGNYTMMNKCLDKMVQYENAGLEAGESW